MKAMFSRASVMVSCLVLSIALNGCAGRVRRFSYSINDRVRPSQESLVGIDEGPPRPLSVVVGPKGSRNEFVANEVVFHPESSSELKEFLTKYNGTVLRDGTPVVRKDQPQPARMPEPSGWYLIRVDPQRSTLEDVAANMKQVGIGGRFAFSSLDGARLAALVARERQKKFRVAPNFLLFGHDFIREKEISEHSDGTGSFINAASFGYMTDQFNQTAGQLGIGVVGAWDYLYYKGIPFGPRPWTPPVVAIIDGGFALDPNTGAPLNANLDFEMGKRPLQFNLVDRSPSAGGQNPNSCTGGSPCPWHGTMVFSTAAAYPRNRFGAAGSGGDIARPLLIKSQITAFDAGEAVRGAALHGASVINMSFGARCLGEFCGYFFDAFANLQLGILSARGWSNAIVVASAGNSGENNNNKYDNVPCTLDGVICVGAIDQNAQLENFGGNGASGTGNKVAIFAPDGIFTTPNPASIQANPGAVGTAALPMFFGTSASAPFVSGIVGLMKAVNPGLTYGDVVSILQSTARKSSDPRVKPGYVDAFQAVLRASPNQPPTIRITSPNSGDSVIWGRQTSFTSTVDDPEQSPKVDGVIVRWTSDRDGNLCTGIACDARRLSFGTHNITATVTDPYGATASDSIKLNAISKQPSVFITYPPSGSIFATSQQINLRGFAYSPSESISDAKLAWKSNLVGPLSSGHDVQVSLPAGEHTITLTATDSLGQPAQAGVTITVQAGETLPTAQILAPSDFSDFRLNESITLKGRGIDPRDGVLPDSSLEWFSDVDGPIGKGNTIQVKLTGGQCAPIYHKITLRVTNKDGGKATHTITLLVGQIC